MSGEPYEARHYSEFHPNVWESISRCQITGMDRTTVEEAAAVGVVSSQVKVVLAGG